MASDWIAVQASTYPDLAASYESINNLLSRKLYHQLADALLAFAREPRNNRGDNLLQMYERVVAPVESKLNQLHVVQFAGLVASQLYPSRPFVADELDRAADFVSKQLARRERLGEERLGDDAYLVARMEVALLRVRKAAALAGAGVPAGVAAGTTLLDTLKTELSEGRELLERLGGGGAEPAVPAAYHRAASEYYKIRGPAAAFYEAALAYLGVTPLTALSPEERVTMAIDVALAALVGEGVYNFGEVNAHPILASLEGTPHAWLIELLRAFQRGDIEAFARVMSANAAAVAAAPALTASAGLLTEKVTLLAVMELAARKAAADRTIPFAELAAALRVPEDAVERVLMRALSLGLVRGSIDEVDRTVNITYIKPRVLDAVQIAVLRERVDAWREKVGTMLSFMEEHTREIFK